MERHKYPRTPHIPWSDGGTKNDRRLIDVQHLCDKEIIVSEKLDGENTTLYSDHYHARSIDSRHHPSQSYVKGIHASIAHDIPPGWRICGENVFARHSIAYSSLTAFFYVFAVYNEDNICLSWNDTCDFCACLGLENVPVLYEGKWDESRIRTCFSGRSTFTGSAQEGYVVRVASAFPFEAHERNTGKFVRANHVQTNSHWKTEQVIPNLLRLDDITQ